MLEIYIIVKTVWSFFFWADLVILKVGTDFDNGCIPLARVQNDILLIPNTFKKWETDVGIITLYLISISMYQT